MTRLVWNSVGARIFETGVDRGVLFLEDLPGVAWSGLISVNEDISDGDITPYYIDGIKYMNDSKTEDFGATIEAYTYPDEFDACIGIQPVLNGLFATQQSKRSFGLSYRTLVGNDLQGADLGYKIHLVYGATAEPASLSHNTVTETIEADHFSWKIATLPPEVVGYAPTSHFVLDSREIPADLLSDFESILYGGSDESRLPSVEELLFIFQEFEAQNFDAGYLTETYFAFLDAGSVDRTTPDSVIDGGGA